MGANTVGLVGPVEPQRLDLRPERRVLRLGPLGRFLRETLDRPAGHTPRHDSGADDIRRHPVYGRAGVRIPPGLIAALPAQLVERVDQGGVRPVATDPPCARATALAVGDIVGRGLVRPEASIDVERDRLDVLGGALHAEAGAERRARSYHPLRPVITTCRVRRGTTGLSSSSSSRRRASRSARACRISG